MAVLPANAAGLVATERHIATVGGASIDTDEARAQPAGDGQGALQRTRHDVAGQPVEAVVGDADGVLLVLEPNDSEDRAEYLFPSDRHGVVDVDEQRGLDPESLVPTRGCVGAANEERGAFVDAFLDVAEDALPLRGRDHRAAERSGLLRTADGDGFVHPLEDLDTLVIPRPREQQPRRNGTALASVHAGRDADHAG